jgi:hypothetical protein
MSVDPTTSPETFPRPDPDSPMSPGPSQPDPDLPGRDPGPDTDPDRDAPRPDPDAPERTDVGQ